jgi:hypothetical protein
MIGLSECETIINEELFVSSHKAILENSDFKNKQPYQERLNKYLNLKEYMKAKIT